MRKIIISDTSCLISITLDKIDQLGILKKLFQTILITALIAKEFGQHLPAFIEIVNPSETNYQKILQMNIDEGEASAIALALECKDPLIIIDDIKGRKIAEELGFMITGTLGVLIEGKKQGHI